MDLDHAKDTVLINFKNESTRTPSKTEVTFGGRVHGLQGQGCHIKVDLMGKSSLMMNIPVLALVHDSAMAAEVRRREAQARMNRRRHGHSDDSDNDDAFPGRRVRARRDSVDHPATSSPAGSGARPSTIP